MPRLKDLFTKKRKPQAPVAPAAPGTDGKERTNSDPLVQALIKAEKSMQNEQTLAQELLQADETAQGNMLRRLECVDPDFAGITQLFNLPAKAWHVSKRGGCIHLDTLDASWFSDLRQRILRLYELSLATDEALLVLGDDWGATEDAKQNGYYSEWGRSQVFHSVDVFHPGFTQNHNHRLADTRHLFNFKDLSGTFDYKNAILVIQDKLSKLEEHYIKEYGGERIVSPLDKPYECTAEQIIAVLEPPGQTALETMETAIRAIISKHLRQGYQIFENPGRVLNHIMDAGTGNKSNWRPVLTHSEKNDIHTNIVEKVLRALHIVNRLERTFKNKGLLT